MKKVFLIILILVATPAYAQIANGAGNTNNQASSGTLMAAVMEQVGYHAQAQVLSNLSEEIESAASLVYLCVIVSILITVGLMGNYRAALWLLVGPPIFFYASGIEVRGQKNTIQGASVEWRFGAFVDTEVTDSQGFTLDDSEVGDSNVAEVSYLFHKYNELISELYQYLIGEITNNDTRSQLIFTSRTRLMEELFAQSAQTPGLVALGQYFTVTCSNEIYYASYLAQGLRNPEILIDAKWRSARDQYCRLFNEPKPFSPGPWQDYLYSQRLYQGQSVTRADNEGAGRRQEHGIITCAQLWQGMMQGSKNTLFSAMERIQKVDFAQAFKTVGLATFGEALDSVAAKITAPENKIDGNQISTARVDCVGDAGAEEVSSSAELIARAIAPFIIQNTILDNPYTKMMGKVSDFNAGYSSEKNLPIGAEPDQLANSFRRQQAHQNSQNRQYEAMAMINFMPYLQGAILYGLAILYPFFCVMLLLPSQAGNFLTWLALWAWVKSWDVGWAIVMVADEVLWELMPKTAYIEREGAVREDNPVSMFEIAFDGDHTYNTATYWLFLTTMVSAVPVISANVILGTKKAVAGTIIKNFTEIIEPFSGGASFNISAAQGRVGTTGREDSRKVGVAGQTLGALNRETKNRSSQDLGGKLDHAGKAGAETKKAGQILKKNGL